MGNLQITQLFSGAVGCIGFGLIYNLRRRYLPLAAVGAFLAGWCIFPALFMCGRAESFFRRWLHPL